MIPTLKPSQRASIEQDLDNAKEQMMSPDMAPYIQDKGAMRRQMTSMQKTLDTQAPKPYENAVDKDKAMHRANELREKFTMNMPSKEEMRHNRDGAVYKHMAWDKEFKTSVLEWREIVKRLEPNSDDPDLTNYERFRPERAFGYDVTGQIQGHHAMSQLAKEQWPLGDPKAKTAISHLDSPVEQDDQDHKGPTIGDVYDPPMDASTEQSKDMAANLLK